MKLSLILFTAAAALAFAQGHATAPDPDAALAQLLAGNHRYVAGASQHPHQTGARRTETAKGQHPFAAILGCSDSRVPPEVLFDEGVGDLFVVRSAGYTPDEMALGSMEYAAEHLGIQLFVVLGHSRCGAVDAAMKDGHEPGHLAKLLDALKPAVAASHSEAGNALDNAVRANIRLSVEKLRTSEPVLAGLTKQHRIRIIGAYYDMEKGTVTVVQ